MKEAEAPFPGRGARDPVSVLDSPTAGDRVIRGSLLRTLGYGAGVLLGIASASLLTRHLGVEDFGKYVVVSSLIAIVAGLTDAGLATIAAREFATREGHDRDKLLRNLLGLRVAIGTVGALAATLFALVAGYESVVVLGTLLAGLGLILATAQQTFAVPLGVTLRLGWISVIDLIRQVAFVGLVVVLVLADAGLLAFLAATLPVGLLVLVVAGALVRGTVGLLPAFDRAEWTRVLRLTGSYAAAAAVGTLYVSAVIVVTSLVGTGEESGQLGAAVRIFSILGAVPLLLVSSAFPVFARAAHADHERLEYALKRVSEVALIVGTWMALATVLGARAAIEIVAGAGYEPAVPVLQIQGGVLVASFLAITAAFALVSLHRHLVLLFGNAVALLTSIVLTVSLVPSYGAKGAAVATLVAELELALIFAVTLFRPGGFELDWGVFPKIALAAAAALALALTPLDGIPLVIAATAVYGAVLMLVRGIPREVTDAFFGTRGGAPA